MMPKAWILEFVYFRSVLLHMSRLQIEGVRPACSRQALASVGPLLLNSGSLHGSGGADAVFTVDGKTATSAKIGVP